MSPVKQIILNLSFISGVLYPSHNDRAIWITYCQSKGHLNDRKRDRQEMCERERESERENAAEKRGERKEKKEKTLRSKINLCAFQQFSNGIYRFPNKILTRFFLFQWLYDIIFHGTEIKIRFIVIIIPKWSVACFFACKNRRNNVCFCFCSAKNRFFENWKMFANFRYYKNVICVGLFVFYFASTLARKIDHKNN